jgi:putative ABC transport system permease protein
MTTLFQDIKYSLRSLLKSPGFFIVSVLTLALGIGANVGIFSIVNNVLLQPLPFPQPDRLVRIFDDFNGSGAKDIGMSVPEFEDLRNSSGLFDDISPIFSASTALTGGDHAERVELLGTTANYFELLGAKPALGRVFGKAEWAPGFIDGAVISDGLWKRQFGSDPNVIGRRIRVDEDPYTIIGVMPPEFHHPAPTLEGDVELWAATGFTANPFPSPPIRAARLLPGAIGRLKAGFSLQQAQQKLDAIVSGLRETYPTDYPAAAQWSIRIEPLQASLTGNVRPTLMVLLGSVSFILLMVCVNVASLLIARSSGKTRELAIRTALGASRTKLVRSLLTESVLVSLAGGAAAILVLEATQKSLLTLVPAALPRVGEIRLGFVAVGLTLLLSAVAGIAFGLGPALQATALDLNQDLKEGGRGSAGTGLRQNRFRNILVTLEIAISVVLLIGAGLLVRSFSTMLRQSPGFNTNGLTVGQVWVPVPNDPNANRYLTRPQRAVLARELLSRMTALPGTQSVAIGGSSTIPFQNVLNNTVPFAFSENAQTGHPDGAAQFGAVSPDYFDVLGIPLKRGRVFADEDSDKTKLVAIVNESFVRAFSQAADVIGRRFAGGPGAQIEIVGVVGDVKDRGLDSQAVPRVYTSVFQTPGYALALFVRTASDPGMLKQAMTRIVTEVDSELPVFGVRTMDELMSASQARRRFSLFLMAVFATIALFLAALGIYGVMASVAGQRMPEYCVRMALGADSRDILLLALKPGLIMSLVGTAVGLGAALIVTRLMSSLLFGVSATDPLTFAGVPIILALVAMLACWYPALGASRVPPVHVLSR